MAGDARHTPAEAYRELDSVRVAKELFTSDWYKNACAALTFSEEDCAALQRVSDETARESAAIVAVLREWAERDPAAAALTRVAHRSRVDFLMVLMEAKSAAGEAVERVAVDAPMPLRARLLDLAAVDFRHANVLREHLHRELTSHRRA